MALAIAVTWTVMLVFARDTHVEPAYREPEIVYVQNYKADRSDADIKAQQKLDLPEEQARKDAIIEAQRKRQQQFKRIDDALNAWGI